MLIDFHAHILPGADHGGDSPETAAIQLAKAAGAGVGKIVATPHFYMQRHTVESFLLRRDISFEKLETVLDGSLSVVKAAEVTLAYDLCALPGLEKLCIGNTNYILLEMPGHNWTYWVIDALYKITSQRGLRPIIAHVDRYDPALLDDLIDLGVLFQVNASALSMLFKRGLYLKMIRNGSIHVLGSDVHGPGEEYDDFAKAVKLLKGKADDLTRNAEAILRGETL